MSADVANGSGLEVAARALGLMAVVEVQGTLAVMLLSPSCPLATLTEDARRQLLDLARIHGFSHLAVELPTAG